VKVIDADQLDADPRVMTPRRILPTHTLARRGAHLHAFGPFVVLIGFERMSGVVVLSAGVAGEESQQSSGYRRP
jgi:hypothetical protein